MTNMLLNEFGRRFMAEVRDEAISDWQMILNGTMKGDRAERLRSLMADQQNVASACGAVVPEIVDSVLYHVLRWMEEDDDFRIAGRIGAENTDNLAKESDGLSGELLTAEGWIAQFSAVRNHTNGNKS